MIDSAVLARYLHSVIEPFHALMYFSPDVHGRLAGLGFEPRSQGYFAARAAPMGAITAGAAEGPFHGFNPALLRAMFPAVWRIATPADCLAARQEGIEATYERIVGDGAGMGEATDLALAAVEGLSFAGRPLAGACAGVEMPGTPWADLWEATGVLREHRGDGHLAVLLEREVDRVESLVLYAGWQDSVSGRFLRKSRMWDEASWVAGEDRLRDRGWLEADGGLSEEGAATRDEIEASTDRLAAAPYAVLGEERSRRLFELLRPVVEAIDTREAYPRSVTVPESF